MSIWRNSHQRCSIKLGALKNFAKFARKHLCQSLFLIKLQALRHMCFPVNFAKFLRTPFIIQHLWWLLLNSIVSEILNPMLKFQVGCCFEFFRFYKHFVKLVQCIFLTPAWDSFFSVHQALSKDLPELMLLHINLPQIREKLTSS